MAEKPLGTSVASSGAEALKKHDLKVRNIVMIVFCLVASGAFGIEEAVASGGPGLTLVLLILFPIIYAMPLSLQIAELGSIMPTDGGVFTWIKETLGEFWGWQAGFWSGLTTWLSQAEYCILVVGYLQKFVEMSPVTAFLLKVGMVLIFTVINLRGIEEVSFLDTVFTIAVVIAFAAVTLVGFMNWQYNPMVPFYNPDSDLFHSVGGSVAILLWMFCGYECVSNMAQEVTNPQVIPKGLIWAQPVIGLSYFLPTLAAIVSIGSWQSWSTESGGGNVGYMDVLIQGIGPWAGVAFLIVAIISNCAIFNSYIVSGSRVWFALADEHLFPKFMCKVSKKTGVPHVSIIAMACVTIFCCQFDFKTLVMATTSLQMLIYVMMVVAVLMLRKKYPVEMRKQKGLYVIPGGKLGLWLSVIPVFIIAYSCCYLNGVPYFLAVFIIIVASMLLYMIFKWCYKGEAVIDPVGHPLNPKTKLGLGDMINIGLFMTAIGAISTIGAGFMQFYEGSYGVEYYLEEFETGLFSNFDLMIQLCLWIGIAFMIVGAITAYIGKKTEGPMLRELKEERKKASDLMLCELHGWDSID